MTKGIFAKFRRTLSICFNFILACCFEVLPLFAITTTQYVEYAEAKANAQAAMGRGCGRSCSRNSSKSKNCKNNNNSGNRSCCKEHNSHNMKINNPNKAKRGSIGCIENLTKTNNEVHSTTAAYKRRLSEPKNQEPPPQQTHSVTAPTQHDKSMGNTQTNNTLAAHEPQTPTNGTGGGGGGTLKSRRGSRVKVFARFSQRKQSQLPPASAAREAATPTSTSAYDDSIEEELMLRQSHAAVLRQLEDEQMDFRKSQKPHSAKKKFSKLFSRRVECDAEEVVVMKDNKPTTASKQKRPAPKPPESKETPPIVPEESATCSRQAITTKQAETISRTSETTKQTENFEYKAPTTSDAALLRGEQTIKQEHEDHREFIEHLFSAVTSNSGSEVMRTAVDDEAIDATDDERESLDYDDEDAGDHAAEFDNTTITTTPTANNDRSDGSAVTTTKSTNVKRVKTSTRSVINSDSNAGQSINVIAAGNCGLTKPQRYTNHREKGKGEINEPVDQCVDSGKSVEFNSKSAENVKKVCVRKFVVQTESWKTANAIKRVEVQYREQTKEQKVTEGEEEEESEYNKPVGAERARARKEATGGQKEIKVKIMVVNQRDKSA
uniref:Uncharacterized protein n=1 Tax=Ceratitis capitata TaxID=7213 RepID=W8AYF4_CERCA